VKLEKLQWVLHKTVSGKNRKSSVKKKDPEEEKNPIVATKTATKN